MEACWEDYCFISNTFHPEVFPIVQSITHKEFGPGLVQMNDSEEYLFPFSARTNIFTHITFVM